MNAKPKNQRLTCNITRDGKLRIEVGIETLAHAAVHSDFCTNPIRSPYVGAKITSARGFAADVRAALVDEAEDGSTLVTRMLDQAFEQAIEQGSEHFLADGDACAMYEPSSRVCTDCRHCGCPPGEH